MAREIPNVGFVSQVDTDAMNLADSEYQLDQQTELLARRPVRLSYPRWFKYFKDRGPCRHADHKYTVACKMLGDDSVALVRCNQCRHTWTNGPHLISLEEHDVVKTFARYFDPEPFGRLPLYACFCLVKALQFKVPSQLGYIQWWAEPGPPMCPNIFLKVGVKQFVRFGNPNVTFEIEPATKIKRVATTL